MHDSFPLLLLFLYNQLGIWFRLSTQSWIDSKIYMVFTFILNFGLLIRPFIKVKHLMIGHALDGAYLYSSTVLVVFFFFFFHPATLMGPMAFVPGKFLMLIIMIIIIIIIKV